VCRNFKRGRGVIPRESVQELQERGGDNSLGKCNQQGGYMELAI